MQRLILIALLLTFLTLLTGCDDVPQGTGTIQMIAIVADSTDDLRVTSTGCQAVVQGVEGNCYALYRNYSNVTITIEAANIKVSRRNVQVTLQSELPKRIGPNRSDGVYWYYKASTIGSITFDVRLNLSK